MLATKKTEAWKELFYIFKRLKLDKSLCWELYPSWQERPWRQTIIWDVFCVASCVLQNLCEAVKTPWWGEAFCGQSLYPTMSLFQDGILLFQWVFLWETDATIILNHADCICVVTGTVSFNEVKRSRAELIDYQWIFRNGSEWKPFVIGNPFLIEFTHLLSLFEEWFSCQARSRL